MGEQDLPQIPIEVHGLIKDDIDSRKAELKFQKSVQGLARIHRDMLAARAIVKTSTLEKDRKRYEVQVLISLPKERFDFSDEGWSLDEVFEKIGEKIKRLTTKPRDKVSHQRHPSRMQAESDRFAD
jgi:ribosome-associated translation inhibitor RaiA